MIKRYLFLRGLLTLLVGPRAFAEPPLRPLDTDNQALIVLHVALEATLIQAPFAYSGIPYQVTTPLPGTLSVQTGIAEYSNASFSNTSTVQLGLQRTGHHITSITTQPVACQSTLYGIHVELTWQGDQITVCRFAGNDYQVIYDEQGAIKALEGTFWSRYKKGDWRAERYLVQLNDQGEVWAVEKHHRVGKGKSREQVTEKFAYRTHRRTIDQNLPTGSSQLRLQNFKTRYKPKDPEVINKDYTYICEQQNQRIKTRWFRTSKPENQEMSTYFLDEHGLLVLKVYDSNNPTKRYQDSTWYRYNDRGWIREVTERRYTNAELTNGYRESTTDYHATDNADGYNLSRASCSYRTTSLTKDYDNQGRLVTEYKGTLQGSYVRKKLADGSWSDWTMQTL